MPEGVHITILTTLKIIWPYLSWRTIIFCRGPPLTIAGGRANPEGKAGEEGTLSTRGGAVVIAARLLEIVSVPPNRLLFPTIWQGGTGLP